MRRHAQNTIACSYTQLCNVRWLCSFLFHSSVRTLVGSNFSEKTRVFRTTDLLYYIVVEYHCEDYFAINKALFMLINTLPKILSWLYKICSAIFVFMFTVFRLLFIAENSLNLINTYFTNI